MLRRVRLSLCSARVPRIKAVKVIFHVGLLAELWKRGVVVVFRGSSFCFLSVVSFSGGGSVSIIWGVPNEK